MTDFTDEQVLAFLQHQRTIGYPVICTETHIGCQLPVFPGEDRRAETPPDGSGIAWDDRESLRAVARLMRKRGWIMFGAPSSAAGSRRSH